MSEQSSTASVSEQSSTASVSDQSSTASVNETIDDLHRDARRWIAMETMLFEVLGRLARSADVPAAARASLATWCHRHARHAELWEARVPVIAHRDWPADDRRAADGSYDFVESTRAIIEADVSQLVRSVLPSLAADHVAAHRHRTDAALDGPTWRILSLVAADYAAEIDELTAALDRS